MTAFYIWLAQFAGSLIVSKIQSDRTDAAAKQKLMDAVDVLWDQASAAHVKVQTSGEKNAAS